MKSHRGARKWGGLTVDTQKGVGGVQGLWLPERPNGQIKAWRKKVGWSAHRLALELGLKGDSYVKHLESEKHPWVLRPGIRQRLLELMASTGVRVELDEPKATLIHSRYVLPKTVYLYVRPRRCRGHARRTCIMSPNQVYCGTTEKERAECRRLWRRRVRREAEEAKNE